MLQILYLKYESDEKAPVEQNTISSNVHDFDVAFSSQNSILLELSVIYHHRYYIVKEWEPKTQDLKSRKDKVFGKLVYQVFLTFDWKKIMVVSAL